MAHQNYRVWKSFITLTFAENVKDIDVANKYFNSWLTRIRRVFSDFAYLAVPEFQKRGSVHYHLLSNLEVGGELLPLQNAKKHMYDVKYWGRGFTSAFDLRLTDDKFNVSLYVCKYLYKDIDNRLFGRKKVMHSQNLDFPYEVKYTSDDLYFRMILAVILTNNDVTEFRFEPNKKFQVGFIEKSVMLSDYELKILCDFLNI